MTPTASPATAPPPKAASVWAPTLSGRLPTLDGLRGIAILAVIAHHYAYDLPQGQGLQRAIFETFRLGLHGVDLFFVLSGFLITGILLDSKTSPRYFTRFYARRTLRIFPLYYAVLFTLFILLPLFITFGPQARKAAHEQAWLWLYASNLLMAWRNDVLFNGEHFNLSHFWSLAVEEQFYLIWPLLVFTLSRRALARVCVACVIIALVCRRILIARGNHFISAIFLTPCRMDALAVGALIAIAARRQSGLPALIRPAHYTLLIAGLAWAALLPTTGGQLWGFSHFLSYTPIACFFGALLCLALNAPPTTLLHRALSTPTLRFFGKYSYALYVFHYLLYPVYQSAYTHLPLPNLLKQGPPALIGLAILSTACSIAAAYASWHLYEKQFLKLKSKFDYS